MVMEIHGLDIDAMRALISVIDAIDSELYLSLLPKLPQSDNANHWSDIRVVSFDEDEIHLACRVGWSIVANILEEGLSEIRLYEAIVPLKQLLDETKPVPDRIQLVKWVETQTEQVSKRNEVNNERGNRRTITKTLTKMDKPPAPLRLEEVVKAVDIINFAIRAASLSAASPDHQS